MGKPRRAWRQLGFLLLAANMLLGVYWLLRGELGLVAVNVVAVVVLLLTMPR